ncbi:hypothetical protein TI39_contig5863g00001 [Zymoseptoria brevis]|uniref:Uncharacterized protein n=1 Tax=Zymoseptoria brevis TaxID=1047168 RepID=A0A0F4G5N8_9PEZI|nr:hypothetical protein TI39_contig5863g00001 [Zymoseptoria brevis]
MHRLLYKLLVAGILATTPSTASPQPLLGDIIPELPKLPKLLPEQAVLKLFPERTCTKDDLHTEEVHLTSDKCVFIKCLIGPTALFAGAKAQLISATGVLENLNGGCTVDLYERAGCEGTQFYTIGGSSTQESVCNSFLNKALVGKYEDYSGSAMLKCPI